MNEYTVKVEGQVIGTRKSPRTYTHAVVAQAIRSYRYEGDKVVYFDIEPKWFVAGYSRTEGLAQKAAVTLANRQTHREGRPDLSSNIQVVAVERREIVKRERIRCSGVNVERTTSDGLPWERTTQCRKDAFINIREGIFATRCKAHLDQDVDAVKASVVAVQEEHNAEWRRRWARNHWDTYTHETCPIGKRCEVHFDQLFNTPITARFESVQEAK